MTSIGGLDVAFGARMHVVRTNVMCVAITNTGLANTTTVPKYILNTYKEALKGTVIEPDFLYLYEIGDMDGSFATTAAIHSNLFNQDTDGDGTADTTSLEVGGVLRLISQCPLARNSAFADTTAAGAADGATVAPHEYYDINGNLALEAVIGLSAMALDDENADMDTVGVFSDDANANTNAYAGIFPQAVQALAFKDVYDNAMATTGGNLNAASKYTGMHKGPFTVDLTTALTQCEAESGGGIATGAAAATVDAWTSSTTFGDMAAAMDTDAAIISMVSLAKVV